MNVNDFQPYDNNPHFDIFCPMTHNVISVEVFYRPMGAGRGCSPLDIFRGCPLQEYYFSFGAQVNVLKAMCIYSIGFFWKMVIHNLRVSSSLIDNKFTDELQ